MREERQAIAYVNLLSPLVKYAFTEAAVAVCHNAQQIFGGLGYMRETGIEQLVRDVRVTTIYEGTSQIQVAASLKSVISDVLKEQFDLWQGADYPAETSDILALIGEIRQQFDEYVLILREYDNDRVKDAAARDLADIYSQIFGSYLLLRGAAVDAARVQLARQFAIQSYASTVSKLTALLKGKYDKWRH